MDVLVIGGNRFVGWLLSSAPRGRPQGHPPQPRPARGPLRRPGRPDRRGSHLARSRSRPARQALRRGGGPRRVHRRRRASRGAAIPDAGITSWSRPAGSTSCARGPAPAREEDYDGPVMARPSDAADVWDWEYGIGKRACEDALPARGARLPRDARRDPDREQRLRLPPPDESYLWRLVDGGPVLLPGGGEHRRHVYGGEVARFLAEILGRPRRSERPTASRRRRRRRSTSSWRPCAATSAAARTSSDPRPRRFAPRSLDPVRLSPFSGRWMSFIDPTRARAARLSPRAARDLPRKDHASLPRPPAIGSAGGLRTSRRRARARRARRRPHRLSVNQRASAQERAARETARWRRNPSPPEATFLAPPAGARDGPRGPGRSAATRR